MNPRKSNISPALSLGLAALLVVGCLMAALGVSFARYRTEEKDGIRFHPAQTAQVYLGYMENGSFICDQSSWEKTAGLLQLSFAVSNGQSVSSYAKANQQATVRLIASLGAWQENSTESMHLFVGDQFYTAVAERIPQGSALFAQFGDGWTFHFMDANGNEPKWDLSGGQFSYIEMQIYCNETAIADTSLLQLQVISEVN